MESETLSRLSRVTESAKEIVDSNLELANITPMSTICQVYYLIVGVMFYKKVGRLWRVSDC